MPVCPYAPHRLALSDDLRCRHCGGDLRLYAALRDLPTILYNRARALWDDSAFEEAYGWLEAALILRPDLREAHWLLGVVETVLGRRVSARRHLDRARELGAEIDPEAVIAGARQLCHRYRRKNRTKQQKTRKKRPVLGL